MVKLSKILALACVPALLASPHIAKASNVENDSKLNSFLDMKSGAAIVNLGYKLTSLVGDEVVEKVPILDTKLGRLTRLAFDVPTALWFTIAQHEYFGHGSRSREFGGTPKVKMSNPWDFPPGGYTFYDVDDRILSDPTKRLALTTGGMESNTVLADYLQDNMLVRPYSFYDALMYAFNRAHPVWYILKTPDPAEDMKAYRKELQSGGDVANYLEELREKFDGKSGVVCFQLHSGAKWHLLDPTFLKILFYDSWKYIWSGQNKFTLPKFMIGTAYNLTPIGPEGYLKGFYKKNNGKLIKAYLRYGSGGNKHFYGAGAGIKNIPLLQKTSLNINLDLWQQENLGWAVNAEIKQDLSKRLSIIVGGVCKTPGYILGEEYKAGLSSDIGIEIKF